MAVPVLYDADGVIVIPTDLEPGQLGVEVLRQLAVQEHTQSQRLLRITRQINHRLEWVVLMCVAILLDGALLGAEPVAAACLAAGAGPPPAVHG